MNSIDIFDLLLTNKLCQFLLNCYNFFFFFYNNYLNDEISKFSNNNDLLNWEKLKWVNAFTKVFCCSVDYCSIFST